MALKNKVFWKYRWWLLSGVVLLASVLVWIMLHTPSPSEEIYRSGVLEVLRGHPKMLDPGLAFLLRGLREDLNCRDETLCLRQENFAFALDLAEQYEHLLGDYQGQICQSGRFKPPVSDRADHQRLCGLLQELSKEVGGVKMNASLALSFLGRSNPEDVRSLLRNFLNRILEHRERVLAITEELHQLKWLEPILSTGQP